MGVSCLLPHSDQDPSYTATCMTRSPVPFQQHDGLHRELMQQVLHNRLCSSANADTVAQLLQQLHDDM